MNGIIVVAPPNVTCPSGYYYWYGDCLLIDTSYRNWFDATANCYAQGGYLASIHSSAENRWVYELLRMTDNAGRDVWIGLNDISQEGTMEWSDGTVVQYSSYSNGQPDNAGGYEHCVHYLNNQNGAWNDGGCSWTMRSLCKYNETLSLPSPGKHNGCCSF